MEVWERDKANDDEIIEECWVELLLIVAVFKITMTAELIIVSAVASREQNFPFQQCTSLPLTCYVQVP